MYDKIKAYFHYILSKFYCSFRRSYNAEHCLLHMIEKVRKIKDFWEGVFESGLADLSKAFDCILREPLLVKLQAVVFNLFLEMFT